MYELDTQIEKDSVFIKNLKLCELRLLKDGEVDWFLLIPRKESIKEWIDLSTLDQTQLNNEINLVSRKLKEKINFDKLNIASLGNMVPQFHLHIIARNKTDRAWPHAIWGSKAKKNI